MQPLDEIALRSRTKKASSHHDYVVFFDKRGSAIVTLCHDP